MISKTKYKDVSFYSGFSYLRLVHAGYVETKDNGFGFQEFNHTVALPASVTIRPPYIQYYLEFPLGTFISIGYADGVHAGLSGNNMVFSGWINRDLSGTAKGRLHYHIYDRAAL